MARCIWTACLQSKKYKKMHSRNDLFEIKLTRNLENTKGLFIQY